jgi:DNA-binding GntR family transcriptional regulator
MSASVGEGLARPPLDAFERVSAADHVLRSLRAAIVDGRIRQGEQLRETQLASSLGTGRGAVREAVRQLVQEGLVQHQVHRGTFVRTIAAADVLDVYRAREAVECAAVRILLDRGEAVDLAPLRAALARIEEAAAGGAGTWRDMADVDICFHETLVSVAGSPRLERMYATLAAESRMHLYEYPPYPALQNVADHARILDALERGSDEAEELMREHLRYSARLASDWRGTDGA